MPSTLKRLPGLALIIANDGTPIGCWEKLHVEAEGKFATPTSADSEYIQKVATQKDAKGSLDTFMGTEAPVFSLYDEFEVLSIKEGTNSVSAALAEAITFGICRVIKLSEDYQADPAKGTIDFEFGFID